jgi:hypothetical protein
MRSCLLVVLMALSGCSSAPTLSDQPLSWQFVDGRDCASAGVSVVDVAVKGAAMRLQRYKCLEGMPPSVVTLPDFAGTLEVIGRSSQEAPLYVGEVSPEPQAEQAVVTLFANAAN